MIFENPNGVPMAHGRNFHMQVAPGEVASRVLVVGAQKRAEKIATLLDEGSETVRIKSNRGFTTITGRFHGVEVSVVSIGMGAAMMDFFVRETRSVVDGPMAIVRYGTCGGIADDALPGRVVIASGGSGLVTRNVDAFASHYDFDHDHENSELDSSRTISNNSVPKYHTSKIAPANPTLSSLVVSEMAKAVGAESILQGVDVTADSFYSSQGRKDGNFDDCNDDVISTIQYAYPTAKSLEMETFTLFHLAQCSRRQPIAASAAAIVLANRLTGTAIDAEVVEPLEEMGGRAILEALIRFPL